MYSFPDSFFLFISAAKKTINIAPQIEGRKYLETADKTSSSKHAHRLWLFYRDIAMYCGDIFI
jgi:hypothetical protein